MGGWSALNPRNFQWISGDNTSGYLAQLFYISDKWRFPLSANPNFGLELSTSLIYSGPPIPIALIQKLLRIDPSLQFIGIWLLIMVILQIHRPTTQLWNHCFSTRWITFRYSFFPLPFPSTLLAHGSLLTPLGILDNFTEPVFIKTPYSRNCSFSSYCLFD
jgi:hypothetical protein